MFRRKLVFGSVAGAVAIHLTFVACSAMTPGDGGLPGDGGMIADVIHQITDSEVRPADAQTPPAPPMELQCDQTSTFTQRFSNGTSFTNTTYFAQAILPGLDPRNAPHVHAVICGRELFGAMPANYPFTCSPGATCGTTGAPYPSLDCRDSAFTSLEPGRVLVYCGSHSISADAMGVALTDNGERFQRTYLRVN